MPAQTGAEQWIQAWKHISILASVGWEASIHDAGVVVDPCPKTRIYLVDLVSDWVWMGEVATEAFKEVSAAGKKVNEVDRDAICGALGTLVTRFSDEREPCTIEQEEEMGLLASLYAGGTKIYAAAKGFPDGCHFAILVYRQPGSDTVMLRPFAINQTPDKPVSADTLKRMVGEVVQIDRARHPGWLEGKSQKGLT